MANTKLINYIELLEMIKNNEIKEGTELLDSYSQIWFYDGIDLIFKKTGESIGEREYLSEVMNIRFEILSESKEIDIESIEEYKEYFIENSSADENVKDLAKKCNDLIKAIKQINRKLED